MLAQWILIALVCLTTPTAPLIEGSRAALTAHGVQAARAREGAATVISFHGWKLIVERVAAPVPGEAVRCGLQPLLARGRTPAQ